MPELKNLHLSLEKDLTRLAAEVKNERGKSEVFSVPEREIVSRSLEKFGENLASEGKPAEEAVASPSDDNSALPAYLKGDKIDAKIKLEIEKLVDLVFHKGLEKAIREAKKHPPFVQDAFHDALVDKLLPLLKERGILK